MMNERVFETFFGEERVEAGNRQLHKPTPKRDSTRSLSKGNWSYYAVVCKCGENFGPSNGIPDEELREWPGLQKHIDDYHEAEAVMIILKGL